ncbi:MAG TPA: hypothetical protein VEU96_09465 [Bryobacteraceae bacterium]|nr:hypothetical protein [Bryobacteraceae bacterium]
MKYVCMALVWLAGIGVARWLFPATLRWSLHNAWLLSLGAGVGIGIASSIYFICLALAGPNVIVLASAEGAFLLVALALGFAAKQRSAILEWGDGPTPPGYLITLLLLAAAVALGIFIATSVNKPHGEWDAWSIWNLRARFLYRGGDSWRDAFSTLLPWSHPDYPLLIPGIVAMSWTLSHLESTAAPIATAFLFTLGAVGLLISTLGVLRGKTQSFVAGILLLGTVSFCQIGAYQYADIPLSFYFLASLSLLCLQDRYPSDLRFTILAGLTAGLGAWTKNEGLLFIVALVLARAIAVIRYGNRATLLPQFLRMAAGLIAPLAVVAFFKVRYAPANDLLSTAPRDILKHAIDIGRWVTVIEGFVTSFFSLGTFLVPIVLVLALYWYLVRFHVEERDRLSLDMLLLTIGFMLAGNFAVYILLPGDVEWQVRTSVERLLLQVWPATLLAFFLAANRLQLTAPKVVVEKGKPAKRSGKAARRAAETR